MKEMYRQGDLLFIKAESLPNEVKLKHGEDSLVVLGSNITGHDHAIKKGEVYIHEPNWRDNANFYLVIPNGGTELVHPEHKTIPLSEGVYKVIRQRDLQVGDPFDLM